jgi:hypothetical protein
MLLDTVWECSNKKFKITIKHKMVVAYEKSEINIFWWKSKRNIIHGSSCRW